MRVSRKKGRGSSPSHQEAKSNTPYELQSKGGRNQKQERLQLYSLKKEITPKNYTNEKGNNYDSDKGARKKNQKKKHLSDLEITNLHEKDFRLMIVKTI